jgi:hypothetical protein
MSWNIKGRYFENCSCDVLCPCTASLSLGADNDYCRAVLAFHVDSGDVEGVDVGGVTVAAVAESGKYMHEGNWKLGVLIDEAASDEQAEAIGKVFSGELGGPMAGLGPLVTENLGVERVPMEFSSEGGKHNIRLGDKGGIAVEDVVSCGVETGEPARLVGIFHPAGSDLVVGQAKESGVNAFGIQLDNVGGSGFSAPFAWSG